MAVEEQIKQLNDARKLVLGDSAYYPQIVQGILPIIGPDSQVELRRWGADFLAETFSTPTLPAAQKDTLCLIVLETLKSMIENPDQDPSVVKSVVQTAASIYPLVFRWIVNNPYDAPTWERMTAIKSRILRIWDSAPTSVRICCIKFAQRVVLVQTAGADTDRRRGDILDISIVIVPPNHTLIPPRNLEAEASGLLDRMLGVFHENSGDAVLIDATLNALSILIRARPHISQKILHAILNYNPLKLANSPMTPKLRVMVKSMEKTTRMLLIHISKRDPHNALAPKIHQQIERLYRSRTEIFDESARKRGHPDQSDFDSAKRQKLVSPIEAPAPRIHIPPLGPGTHTLADFFTATSDQALKSFDVGMLNEEMVRKIVISILGKLDPDTFNQTINGIRERYLALSSPQAQAAQLNPNTAPLGVDDDDDDYEPDFQVAEDTEQILNKLDGAPPLDTSPHIGEVAIGPFKMPTPSPMTASESSEAGRDSIMRVFGMMQSKDESLVKRSKSGINRLAANNDDRDSWITVISRLATRSASGLENPTGSIKTEGGNPATALSSLIREYLYRYVLDDFRKRTDIVVAWLCEEWYNDRIQMKSGGNPVLHYEKWVLRILDGITPYLDARDKFLTRFLGEIPGLSVEVLDRVKALCRNPAMVNLAVNSLFYLVVMRPPAKKIALDAMEDIWSTYDDAKPMTAKYLGKYRPGFLESQTSVKQLEEEKISTSANGQNGIVT